MEAEDIEIADVPCVRELYGHSFQYALSVS